MTSVFDQRTRRRNLGIVSAAALAAAALSTGVGVTDSAAGAAASPLLAQAVSTTYDTGPIPFEIGDVLGDIDGVSESDPPNDVVIGNDPGEDTTGNIVDPKSGLVLFPIDSSFTTDVLDFFGATPHPRDGIAEEGYVGVITDDIDGVGELTGLQFSDAETKLFKAGAPLGTWAAGLGDTSVKASTEQYTVMEGLLTCYQTYPYDFWESYDDWAENNPSVPVRTAEALANEGLVCEELTDPTMLTDLDGVFEEGNLDSLIPNEDSVIDDMLVDPDNNYSVTKKDDGKLLFRWGSSVKKPTDIRFQKTLPLPADWLTVPDGEKGFAVTSAELIVRHNITNNPNDQIRPEDWENEAAIGLLPGYTTTPDGYWESTVDCYEGDGDFIPAGTTFKYPAGALPEVDAEDLAAGNTPAWYTSLDRDPFQWAYDTGAEIVGSRVPDATLGELVSGPRWRLTSNKFGQNLPGLEIPSEACSPPPYQKGEIRYETGEFTTTVINLLDWDADEPRWDDAISPFAYSAGWISSWSAADVVGQVVEPDDAIRCNSTNGADECVTDLGTTLTDGLDVSFYVKGDIKPLSVYDVQLVVDYEPYTEPNPILDFGDAPDSFGTTLASDGPRHVAGDLTLGATVDTELDGLPGVGSTGDDLDGIDDEDGVTFTTVTAGEAATASVAVAGSGYVQGWIDFDGNGVFDADEQIATNAAAGDLTFTVPSDAVIGASVARFRVGTSAGVAATGFGGVGEVEDHVVTIDAAVDPPVTPAQSFVVIDPVRVLDTRLTSADAQTVGSRLVAETDTQIAVSSLTDVPDDAVAVAVNVTAARALDPGFVTVYPCDESLPTASNLTFSADRIVAASAFAPIVDGEICVFNSSQVELIVDVFGYAPNDGTYEPVTPVRLADTRLVEEVLGAGETLTVDAPATSAAARAVTVAAVRPTGGGFLTVWACGADQPDTSTVNYSAGLNVTNLTVVGPGDICVFASTDTHVIVDVHGEFSEIVDISPTRLVDTRTTQVVQAGQFLTVDPGDHPELSGAEVAVFNVASVRAEGRGYLTEWSCDTPRPDTSVLNYDEGVIVSNLVVVDVTKPVCFYAYETTDVLVDLAAVLS